MGDPLPLLQVRLVRLLCNIAGFSASRSLRQRSISRLLLRAISPCDDNSHDVEQGNEKRDVVEKPPAKRRAKECTRRDWW